MTARDRAGERAAGKPLWLRLLPALVLAAGLLVFFALGGHRYVSFEEIKRHRDLLKSWVSSWGVLAGIAYTLLYAVMIAFSIPGGALATMVGGFLFGVVGGAIAAVTGATLGATALFLAARTALGDALRKRAAPALRRMEKGFRQDAFSYLLGLRLIPVLPFWLVNLVPAFTAISLRVYALATFLGIIPGTIVYAWVGSGIDEVLRRGETPDLMILLEPQILLPFLGLAVLALVPVIWKKLKGPRPNAKQL